ncbi:MAG: nitroreductase family deazaflavin-dependent oxidoreductase [Microcella sp.]|uniref:nitroreductase/quinone reductase family protein n=1 Tax=Microcella sp. TaxID=1913979 RepID=UPI0024CB8EE2|nr:nitroreductase/quinone reductase family protein [Microcella sp.]UYN83029.1 MAG: nitroreductase family deazaflavin-dependent oxidoreductase [Microcella sp.]
MTHPADDATTRIPPRWFIRAAWRVHRMIYRLSNRRRGLRRPTPTQYGMMALRTTGRRTGDERLAIVAYLDDGDNLVTMAMNGWQQAPPAWWLNLQEQPEAHVELRGEPTPRPVRARAAVGAEHDRLWAAFRELADEGADLDALARLRSSATPLVVLEPRTQ